MESSHAHPPRNTKTMPGFVSIPLARVERYLHGCSAAPLVAQIRALLSASSAQDHARELKRLSLLVERHPPAHADARVALAGVLFELLLVAHPYALHSQLKGCVAQLCALPRGSRMLEAALALQVRRLLDGGSLLACGAEGLLREGQMPGWLELLLQVPLAAKQVQAAPAKVLRVLASSIADALLLVDRHSPGAGTPYDSTSAVVQELSKLLLLLLREVQPWLRGVAPAVCEETCAPGTPSLTGDDSLLTAVREAGHTHKEAQSVLAPADQVRAALEAQADCLEENGGSEATSVGRGDDALNAASAADLAASLRVVCSCSAELAVASALAADAGLACCHLLVSTLDAVLPPSLVAREMQAVLARASAGGEATLAVVLRGLAQGASVGTLCSRLDGGADSQGGELLFWQVAQDVLRLCDESTQPFVKLFSFRALEALVAHAEKLPAALSTELTTALRPFFSRAVQLLWDHWEVSFQSLTGMLAPLLKRLFALLHAHELTVDASARPCLGEVVPAWLQDLLAAVRAMDWTRRAKYRTIQAALSVLPHGSSSLLQIWPTMLEEIFQSLSMPNYKSYAAELLADVMRSLSTDPTLASSAAADSELAGASPPSVQQGPSSGSTPYERWHALVISPFLTCLSSANSSHADNVLQATLPALLAAQPEALQWVLQASSRRLTISPQNDRESAGAPLQTSTGAAGRSGRGAMQVARLVVGLLKSARCLGLLTANGLADADKEFVGGAWPVRGSLLASSLLSDDEQLALDAIEVVCTNPKLTDPVSPEEMQLLQAFLPLRLKGTSANSRKQIVNAMRKWLFRLRASTFCSAQLKRDLRTLAERSGSEHLDKTEVTKLPERLQQAAAKRAYADDVGAWLKWYGHTLLASMYPTAPCERALLALELYASLVDVWTTTSESSSSKHGDLSEDPSSSLCWPLAFELFCEKSSRRLISLVQQTFDSVRSVALRLLSLFPHGVLPGFSTPHDVVALVRQALPLLQSPRAHESEAGASLLKLVFSRYVLRLGWKVVVQPSDNRDDMDVCVEITEASVPGAPDTRALTLAVEQAVEAALGGLFRIVEGGLAAGTLRGGTNVSVSTPAVHGPLVAIRLLLEDVEEAASSAWAHLKDLRWIETGLVQTVERCRAVSLAALAVISDPSPEGGATVPSHQPPNTGSIVTHNFALEMQPVSDRPSPGVADAGGGSIADWGFLREDGADDDDDSIGTCTTKGKLLVVLCWLAIKESSLLLAQACKLALSTCATSPSARSLLQATDLDSAGRAIMHTLLSTRHNGAIEKSSVGLRVICERLLACDGQAELSCLPFKWLQYLLEAASGESVTHMRRSAGLPFALLALLSSEATIGKGSHMLVFAMERLLIRAEQRDDLAMSSVFTDPDGGDAADAQCASQAEYSWMGRVHALNLLRRVFLDRALSIAVVPFISRGFLIAFYALESPLWAVRNSGLLLLSAMLERALRQRRSREEHSMANGIGIRDFFLRAPELHSFLLHRLERSAVEALGPTTDLFPCLLLLSKLVPSPVSQDTKASALDIDSFVPLVQAASALPSLHARTVASRALVPLVPPSGVASFLVSLAFELQTAPGRPENLHNRIHGLQLQMIALARAAISSGFVAEGKTTDTCTRTLNAIGPSLWLLLPSRNPCHITCMTMTHLVGLLLDGSGWTTPMQHRSSAMTTIERPELTTFAAVRACTRKAAREVAEVDDHNRCSAGFATCRAALLALEIRLLAIEEPLGDAPGETERGLLRMVDDPHYEVRLTALLLCRHYCGLMPSDIDDGVPIHDALPLPGHIVEEETISPKACARLFRALVPLAASERQRSCLLHVLQLLNDLLPIVGDMKQDVSVTLWHTAEDYARKSRDVEVIALSLQLSTLCSETSHITEARDDKALDAWVERMSSASEGSQPVLLRLAAVNAIGSSAIIRETMLNSSVEPLPSGLSRRFRVCLLALNLLDDDDDDVRSAMARRLAPLVSPGGMGVHASLVLQLGWGHLATRFPRTDALLDELMQRLVGLKFFVPVDERATLYDTTEEVEGERILFAKEADNFYEEPLQQAQLAANLMHYVLGIRADEVALQAEVAVWMTALQQKLSGLSNDRHFSSTENFVRDTQLRLALWALSKENGNCPTQDPLLSLSPFAPHHPQDY